MTKNEALKTFRDVAAIPTHGVTFDLKAAMAMIKQTIVSTVKEMLEEDGEAMVPPMGYAFTRDVVEVYHFSFEDERRKQLASKFLRFRAQHSDEAYMIGFISEATFAILKDQELFERTAKLGLKSLDDPALKQSCVLIVLEEKTGGTLAELGIQEVNGDISRWMDMGSSGEGRFTSFYKTPV